MTPRLGVNIDHVATIRNARGGVHPDPVRAAQVAVEAGADGITAHLREDRRHITDNDIDRLMSDITKPLNLEMAVTSDMLAIALRHKPHAACLVPERREERTTEGGLRVLGAEDTLYPFIAQLSDAGMRVSLFIEPDLATLEAAQRLKAPVVELHTGRYCDLLAAHQHEAARLEFARLKDAAAFGVDLGLEVHAGHGLNYETAAQMAQLPTIAELNIGHFMIGEAVFESLATVVQKMRAAIHTPTPS